ncbi:hypothetical protein JYU34_018884 [Plutella xylostella]|uniref:hypoxia-inducible factor-proline dioxygenase n=1 Tax=Plutella xylostella TaxID=51655 RepID=A0ABQ7PYY6_PLUXY|nr:hypothetical protein JYU34_018884 [Plutella xylostella]
MNSGGELARCAVCSTETQKRCSRCLKIYYCSKEHQREDWKRHASECIQKLAKQTSKKGSKASAAAHPVDEPQSKVEETVETSQQNRQNNVLNEGSDNLCKQTSHTNNENTSENVANSTVDNVVGPSNSKGNSVISSVVCTNKDTTKLSAITYEGSSETEIYNDTAQQLSTADFMSPAGNAANVLKSVNRSNKAEMSKVGHRDYPEASLKGTAVMNNCYLDNNDPYHEICLRVIRDMTTYGVCVLDNFLGRDKGLLVRNEVLEMYRSGIFTAGQLVSDPGGTGAQSIRSDRITWMTGREPHCHNIGTLINQVDSIVIRANKMPDNGRMGDYIINTRTKAMVACYPGSGSNYVKHVDNPNKDGRCITAIYYLNLDWDVRRCGGLLRVFPEGTDKVANIEPIFDRMLFFWSDRRNPHEVQPAFDTRYAITLWYFDAQEREEAIRLYQTRGSQPSSSK